MPTANIFFIIGVNGVGKSSVIPFLKNSLDEERFTIHDFDERGVPNNADQKWRQSETLYWLKIGEENIKKNISTIVCGFIKPTELHFLAVELKLEPTVILLDAEGETITKRIFIRYQTPESLVELLRTTGKTPEKFAQDNVWISSTFREDCKKLNYLIINTNNLNSSEVALKILKLIKK